MYKNFDSDKNNTPIYYNLKYFTNKNIIYKIVYVQNWHVNCIKESERFRERRSIV